MNKIINLVKKPWILSKNYKKTSILCLIAIGVVSYFVFFNNSDEAIKTTEAQMGDVVQEVSVGGRVKAAEAVDLAFERSGKISSVSVKVGDKIFAGQALVRLDSSELLAQRSRELANVESAKQKVNQLISNSGLKGDKEVARTALEAAINGLVLFTDVQLDHFTIIDIDTLSDLKKEAVISIYGNYAGGLSSPYFFLDLNGGLKGKINNTEDNNSETDYLVLLEETEKSLLATQKALEYIRANLLVRNTDLSAVASLDSAIGKILSQMSVLTSQKKIAVGGDFDIDIAKLQLTQTEASLALIDAQLAKYSLYAPFSGTVTAVAAKKGEISNPGTSAVSLIGKSNLEIEAPISEADVAKITVGNEVNITLDAYDSDDIFKARLVHIDPAGKIVDGVAVYLATFQFLEKNDTILPGLTADLDIKTNEKKNVLYIPSRDVISRDGKKYAKVLIKEAVSSSRFANLVSISESDKGEVFEVEIKTGLKGSDGRIEITSGLQEGDQIVKE